MTTDDPDAVDPDREDLAVQVDGVTKTFGTVRALDDVDLAVRRGTIHALVGENGSGKSTLTKVIAGAHPPDAGTVSLGGELIEDLTPRDALRQGVRVIYQDFALFPNMTVADNIGFDGGVRPAGLVPRARNAQRTREALDTLGLSISPSTRLGSLSTAERQLVAIARAVSADGRIILMDEPTAALTQKEIDVFLSTVRHLACQGLSFVFISHKLREVVEIADDVSIIRDGRIVAGGRAADFDQERISTLMTGGAVSNVRRDAAWDPSERPLLAARGLRLGSVFADIDLEVHPGRVTGLSGLVGCGKIEIGLALAGLIPIDRGRIELDGTVLRDPRSEPSIQYVPDDRLTEGLMLDWSIADNIAVNSLDQTAGRGGLQSVAKLGDLGRLWRKRLRIKTPTVAAPVSALSGGNQQRVLLSRTLAPGPRVLILNNPTVGVDVGSRAEIHDLVRSVADDGTAVLLISDEPAELMSVCDDIAFVVDGRITQRRAADQIDEDGIIDINGQEKAA
ncbi:sugar ABC transporter ATP-binding protein [Brachybacterium sp. AOP43-C2-M15]|uniref:sugar ABC transporter ATP-binding protein n=1 Tax=Brachybacterium sp. AOP43-C2-M15 TaxID=3457661 RepID=UPI0040332594